MKTWTLLDSLPNGVQKSWQCFALLQSNVYTFINLKGFPVFGMLAYQFSLSPPSDCKSSLAVLRTSEGYLSVLPDRHIFVTRSDLLLIFYPWAAGIYYTFRVAFLWQTLGLWLFSLGSITSLPNFWTVSLNKQIFVGFAFIKFYFSPFFFFLSRLVFFVISLKYLPVPWSQRSVFLWIVLHFIYQIGFVHTGYYIQWKAFFNLTIHRQSIVA